MEAGQGQGTDGHWPDHDPFQTALQQAEAGRLGMMANGRCPPSSFWGGG